MKKLKGPAKAFCIKGLQMHSLLGVMILIWGCAIRVNSKNDVDDGMCDSSHCSLREAINLTNAIPDRQAIFFEIGSGHKQIVLMSPLPTITDPVVINGTSQPGFAGIPIIELYGNFTGANVDGLKITAGDSTIKGLAIGGFDGYGIRLEGKGNNQIKGNFIGLQDEDTRNRNHEGGMWISSSNNTIGGTAPEDRNIISGNSFSGVYFSGSGATGNVLQGNFIGTDATGTKDIDNTHAGVIIQDLASNNTIGGTTQGTGNLISGNGGRGIWVLAGSTGNVIQGNNIGTQIDGVSPLKNAYQGVIVSGDNNLVGGTVSSAGNIIAYNGQSVASGGVAVTGNGNAVRRNSIFSNFGLGISLCGGTPCVNDNLDSDTGGNAKQNYPVLTSANSSVGSTTIQGTLHSTANQTFSLEFFSNKGCDSSGYGEGASFIGEQAVQTNAFGNASFTVVFSPEVPAGWFITATATDTYNNTSEFSACIPATSGQPPSARRGDSNYQPY